MRREGVSSSQLLLGVLGIKTWRVEMPHLQIHEMKIREKRFMHKHVVSVGGHTIREAEEKSTSTFRGSRLGESRCLISRLTKYEFMKSAF
jgi:hypothetical protein